LISSLIVYFNDTLYGEQIQTRLPDFVFNLFVCPLMKKQKAKACRKGICDHRCFAWRLCSFDDRTFREKRKEKKRFHEHNNTFRKKHPKPIRMKTRK